MERETKPRWNCRATNRRAKEAYSWGIYDMIGNLWEWTGDHYAEYPNGFVSDPVGPTKGSYRVYRGGSWSLNPQFCRSAHRNGWLPDFRSSTLNFRLLREVP